MSAMNPTQGNLRRMAWFFIVLMVTEIVFPTAAMALTSGPTQPEVRSFEPVGTTEMVNLFSGDFTYNIPLFEVPGPNGGYPVNLFYNSVTNTDEEASWTGLGWNINMGSLSRTMRGVPDDFNGEQVKRRVDMRDNTQWSVGIEGGAKIELAGAPINIGVGLGINYVYNSYRGAGLSLDPSIRLGFSPSSGKYKAGLNIGLNLSSIEDANFNVGLSFSDRQGDTEIENPIGSFNAGFSLNGRTGISNLSLGYTKPAEEKPSKFSSMMNTLGLNTISANISFARASYTPSASMPWTGFNISGKFAFTPGGSIAYAPIGFKGSYGKQWVKDGGLWQGANAYGLNYLQNTPAPTSADAGDRFLMDFNREKDGSLNKHTRFLSNPIMTNDIYSVVGQGIGGVYKAYRSEYGLLYDQPLHAISGGGSIGGEVGPYLEWGVDVSLTFSGQFDRPWIIDEVARYGSGNRYDVNYEPFYYRAAGDVSAESTNTYDYLGGDEPLSIEREDFEYKRELRNAERQDMVYLNNGNNRANRKPRNMSIQHMTNRSLTDQNGADLLPEYAIQYYPYSQVNSYMSAPTQTLNRPSDNDQNGGFTVVGQDGVRWTYGLPVMNNKHREVLYSVDPSINDPNKKALPTIETSAGDTEAGEGSVVNYKGLTASDGVYDTNQFLDEKDIPAYAHSHMLTSVVGSDYVDVDGNGPSDNDVGYWMKTNYVKVSDDYQWRAPFMGANYMPGLANTNRDDMGSFMWGEREVYLPATIETKTHIAHFYVSKRLDGRGANNYITSELSVNGLTGAYSYKLDKIELYSKKEINGGGTPVPLKTIHFEYDYSLCKLVQNNNFNDPVAQQAHPGWDFTNLHPYDISGKLTLKKVWFTYEGSNRGALSPYEFDYGSPVASTPGLYYNEEYSQDKVDRWGVYADIDISFNDPLRNPYTAQYKKVNGANSTQAAKDKLDENIATWHLKKIKTPSGATIELELERDDYAYVQGKVAHQMMPIYEIGNANRLVIFELEKPLSTQEELNKYVEDLQTFIDPIDGTVKKQVYMKAFVNLRNDNNNSKAEEYVPIYANIQEALGNEINFDSTSLDSGLFSRAFISLEERKIKEEIADPIAVFSWNFLRNRLPNKIYELDLGTEDDSFTGLGVAGHSLEAIFSGYFRYAKGRNFGEQVDLSKSYIRLNSPDKIKYGGDIRVKEVRLQDKWAPNGTEQTSTIGVVYDYTTEDEDGTIISSGVVENEPTIGYDECALRVADVFPELRNPADPNSPVDDIHVYEFPINEGYYPGAKVGYSKVTVRSIASNYAKNNVGTPSNLPPDLAAGFSTTGETINEFYTAKDFPIITSYTNIDRTASEPWMNAILSIFTTMRFDFYTGTQGYSIELNDMHGKPKRVASYAQKSDGSISEEPLTLVEYEYKSKDVVQTGENPGDITMVHRLDNEVDVLLGDDPNGNVDVQKQLLGVDYEFFIDSRESVHGSMGGGVQFNADIIAWWPLPFPWPDISVHNNKTRVSTANKIIMRHGILEKTHAYDGQSHITTTNKVFNAQTGAPVLMTVDNQLGGQIYNYTIPADLAHSSMGSAAKNWGSLIQGNIAHVSCTGYYSFTSNGLAPSLDHLVAGDEMVVESRIIPQGQSHSVVYGKSRAIYMGYLRDDAGNYEHQFDVLDDLTLIGPHNLGQLKMTFQTVRSGNRNLLNAAIAQYSTVDTDPNQLLDNGNPLANRGTGNSAPVFLQYTPSSTSRMVDVSTIASSTQVSYKTLNNVLSASGNSYKDEWIIEHSDHCLDLPDNPYLRGEKGVWRMQSSYAYIADRDFKTTADGEVDILTSGVVHNVPMYNWRNPFFEYAVDGWVRTEDVTKYNLEGNAVEARDVIGNYQAEIYGLNDNLVAAKGVNTRYYEMGYESFEDPNTTGTLSALANAGFYNTGNLNFLPKPSNCTASTIERQENYRLSFPMAKPNSSGLSSYILVRKPYDDSNPLPKEIRLNLYQDGSKEEITVTNIEQNGIGNITSNNGRIQIPGLAIVLDDESKSEFTVYKLTFPNSTCVPNLLAADWWAGDATLVYDQPLLSANDVPATLVSYTDSKAHTGKYSLSLNFKTGSPKFYFPQPTLRLEKGKKYVFSAWVSTTGGAPRFTYGDGQLLQVWVGGLTASPGTMFLPDGPAIEGWQRVEGEFVYDGTEKGKEIVFYHLSNERENILIDDVRIFPAKANMQSYVYDPVDYKLRATLDNNNYATFYVYNPAGDLILTKQETERGVKTIQEARNYVQPNN